MEDGEEIVFRGKKIFKHGIMRFLLKLPQRSIGDFVEI